MKVLPIGAFSSIVDVVAGRAGDAVAGEAAVLRVLLLLLRGGLEGDRLHLLAGEELPRHDGLGILVEPQEVGVVADRVALLRIVLELIEAELPLAHHAVAVEAEVRRQLGERGVGGLLRLELREEDRDRARRGPSASPATRRRGRC